MPRLRRIPLEYIFLLAAALFPLTGLDGSQITDLFVFAILALGLNVVVGYTGLLNLGIAAFFGIGAYVAGILASPAFPFQFSFPVLLAAAAGVAAFAGILLGAPTLRLRGDYLALVTLGFGEVVRYSIKNLESITEGPRGLTALPPPFRSLFGIVADWPLQYHWFYYLSLGLLAIVVWLLRNLERSSLGRAWVAIREDELAATCMGINAARAKLAAFALGAGLAGMAGCLYALKQTTTTGPDVYDFSRSVITLCCVILGGLGSIRGTLLGVFLLVGFDSVLTPKLDNWMQQAHLNPGNNPYFSLANWRLMVFGVALVILMRFRPEGLLPSRRLQHELHPELTPSTPAAE